MQAIPYIGMALTAVGALADYRAKQAQAQQLEAQATQSELQGRANAVAYKRQGNEVLRRMNQVMAANIARGSAKGINPFGSKGVIEMSNMYNRRLGISEFQIARDNATMAKEMAKYQAGQQLTAAKTIRQLAPFQMVGKIATGYMTTKQIYGDQFTPFQSFSNAVTPTPTYSGGLGPYG